MSTEGGIGVSDTGSRPAAGPPTETVLVVDDEELLRTMLSDFIREGLGMRALEAEEGEEALRLLEAERVDLVILDIIMPGMDGLETLRRIKARWATVPVVILTGSASMENAIAALREGADDFFRKPVSLDELALCATRALSKTPMVRRQPAPPREAAAERRQTPRLRVQAGTTAQLLSEVFLIEISRTGALIEHTDPVNPGEIYRLCLAMEGREVEVLARTIRALAGRRDRPGAAEQPGIYRTGVEFVGVGQEAARAIACYVDRLARSGSPAVTP